jgi:hypothetical protein
MAATKGAGAKAGVTSAARDAAQELGSGLQRLEIESTALKKRYVDLLVGEGVLSPRDVSTLKKIHHRLYERGKNHRYRSSR